MAGADFLSLLGASGGPSVVALGAFYLLMRHELRDVKDDIREMRKEHKDCHDKRAETEETLHGRCTENAKDIERIKGRMNGHEK